MMIEVLGSNPELGSSQNKYLGFMTIARAMATRFCIPPEISEGSLVLASIKFTRLMTVLARSRISSSLLSVSICMGNIIFSSTDIESNRALPWNTMPMS